MLVRAVPVFRRSLSRLLPRVLRRPPLSVTGARGISAGGTFLAAGDENQKRPGKKRRRVATPSPRLEARSFLAHCDNIAA